MYLKKNLSQGVLVSVLLLFFAVGANAQGMYGFDGGLGKATSGKSYITPTFSGYYMKKFSRTFYLGGAVGYERYSFLQRYNPVAPVYGDIISIRQKSSYFTVGPKVDIGVGYRKYWHAFFSFGIGMLAGGNQVTNRHTTYLTTPPTYTGNDTAGFHTSYDLPVLISRYNLGISRRIPTEGHWNITISAQYSVVPTNLTTHGPALRTNYFALTVGIMHKYPMVLVEY